MTKADTKTETKKTKATTKKTAVAKKAEQPEKKTTPTPESQPPKTMDEYLNSLLHDDPMLTITVSWADVQPHYNRVLSAVAKTLKVSGFRPGKVPPRIAEERVRQDYLIGEVSKYVLAGRLDQAIKDSKEKPEAEPNVMVTKAAKGQDWEFHVALPQRTVIKLPEYKKFIAKKKKEIRETLQKMYEDEVAAAKKEKRQAPPAPDEAQQKARATDEALVALLAQIKPTVSRTLVSRGAQQEYDRLVNQLGQYQVTWDDYLKNSGLTEEMLWQQLSVRAAENIQMEFMLDALMAAEKITATKDELIAKMKEVMPEVTTDEDRERQLSEPSVRDYLELITKRQKLATWLLDL